MSSAFVLDASAVLALINGEPGQDEVAEVLAGSLMSAVNLAEVVSKLAERGMPASEALADTLALGMQVIPVDTILAGMVGALRPLTRAGGLSLGDRCCLALAQQRDRVVMTCERSWPPLAAAIGVRIQLIRPSA